MAEKEVIYSERAKKALERSAVFAISNLHEFVTPEHLLHSLLEEDEFTKTIGEGPRLEELNKDLDEYLGSLDKVPEELTAFTAESHQLMELINDAESNLQNGSATEIDIPHLVEPMLWLQNSMAAYLLRRATDGRTGDFMAALIERYGAASSDFGKDGLSTGDNEESSRDETHPEKQPEWRTMVTCLNDHYASRNPLIGREAELRRTIQVLCRREKNNPLHVGEPGVGKTALAWGLARMIEEGRVPERLKGSRIYMMDMTTVLAGTQYRGDFEKRLKAIMDGVQAEAPNNIVYIDEIHMMVGAGATGNDAMDASNIMKPYLESGAIRFIGSTTYEEFNRQFSKSKGLIRRFQKIDVEEPTPEEARNILRQLQPLYEEYHGVSYTPESIDYAVDASSRHITDRYLPDKAIDLIDETGAAMQMSGIKKEIGVKEMADVLAKMCKVDALAVAEKDDYERLMILAERMTSQIYGQDDAIRQVVESVQMSRAGLLESEKPLASLLFVGPTGVGKTEVARTLARELGVELLRFDMSEYQEKHSVAKLIGSPAGYVGYEDGGLLTDAVRKSPNAVLLLDEIEKAHQDIYNILLQVTDYGRLTDNKGRHADFRNIVLIMTSNAGAQHASQATVGFASSVTRGSAMMKQVKRTFKPEFLNRLSGTVVFNDMDHHMAELILRKKLGELEKKLEGKSVKLELAPEAFELLLREGFAPEYGAREMDRVIRQRLNPPLMREILFGALRSGGTARVGEKDGNLILQPPEKGTES